MVSPNPRGVCLVIGEGWLRFGTLPQGVGNLSTRDRSWQKRYHIDDQGWFVSASEYDAACSVIDLCLEWMPSRDVTAQEFLDHNLLRDNQLTFVFHTPTSLWTALPALPVLARAWQ